MMQLIEAYPQLEDVLIDYVPAFSKLKNPVLRRTVARIATLQQAAAVGNVKVEDLINRLRKEVGQDLFKDDKASAYNITKPSWFSDEKVTSETDIREMLARGEQPVNQVMSDLNHLQPGKILRLTAPFLPAPLIDKATSLSISHWLVRESDEKFIIYFNKNE